MNRIRLGAGTFLVFLKLGLTSFGGPVAHLGYFRDEFVVRRKWLDDESYADLVALCQFLPGPASSQVAFSLGLMRAGWTGAAAAFVAFTLPSAFLMYILATTASRIPGELVHGLKVVAVAIVAQAVLGMARNLCPDRERAAIAAAALLVLVFLPGAMIEVILLGGLAGFLLRRGAVREAAGYPVPVSRWAGLAALALFLVEPGLIGEDVFLAGYAAAQAMPGPLFAFAAWLGAHGFAHPQTGAAIALLFLFLPGFLVLVAALPFWSELRRSATAQSAMQGANAAVVGILGAALYSPVFTSSVHSLTDLSAALLFFLMLVAAPSWLVVLTGAVYGLVFAPA
jgi:chromate transporter